jgi:hypothetical protein
MNTNFQTPTTMAELMAWVDQHAAEMVNRGLTSNHAQSLVEDAKMQHMRWLNEMVRDRLRVYETAAPWDLYPHVEHGQKLALLLAGAEECEHDRIMDTYLDPIQHDLIRRGFSAKVASDWCLNLVEEAVWYLDGIENAGGVTVGMA